MKKITLLFLMALTCSFGFSQSFPGTGTPVDMQNGSGDTDDLTCGTEFELALTTEVTGVGVLGITNILDQVDIDITHTWSGDVNVTLIAPDGTEVNLTDGNGSSGDNYTATEFRDDAAGSITAGTAPFTGPFQPEEALATFNGVDADGIWTLSVCDSANGDVGTFNSWSITFDAAPSCLAPSVLGSMPMTSTTAELSWTAGQTETSWNIEVVDITAGETATGTATASGVTNPYTLSGLTEGSDYEFYVQSDCAANGTSIWAGPFAWSQILPPPNTDCASAIAIACGETINATSVGSTGTQEGSGCFMGVNGIWFTFTGTGADITVSSDASFDHEMAISSGSCGALVNVGCDDGSISTETYTFASVLDETYYVYIANWSASSSVTGTVDISLTCAVVPECDAAVIESSTIVETCSPDGTGTFVVDIVVTDAGDAGGLFDDGTNTYPVVAGTITVGPYNTGDSITIEYTAVDTECSSTLGVFTYTCPLPAPANDDCLNAEVVIQESGIADADSATATSGTVAYATDSGYAAEACGSFTGTANDDVWYSFVATTENVNIDYTLTFDGVAILYSGTCDALTYIECSDDLFLTEEINATGLTIGDTYYTRIFSYAATTLTSGDFTVKIWSPDTALSLNDLESEAAFTYYPNPVKNTLTLNAKNTIEQVAMYNMLGQEVLRANPNTLNSNLDMSTLQTGTYFVKVTIGNVTETIRVMKQ
ncbi:proprotein convertase P-domain-containing protein [Winogradskyella wichelsiae]|uniref:proprotein convertase P-domain-containing protein n=1 Tax=Winogradskyella wichelsiae TaxID=2697007 RepID=UPI003EF1CFE2